MTDYHASWRSRIDRYRLTRRRFIASSRPTAIYLTD